MCETCGCSDGARATVINLETGSTRDLVAAQPRPGHARSHDHGHTHDAHQNADEHGGHEHAHSSTVPLQEAVLARNDARAELNRAWFAGREILALNLVSGPGAGKTALLERTIRDLAPEYDWVRATCRAARAGAFSAEPGIVP